MIAHGVCSANRRYKGCVLVNAHSWTVLHSSRLYHHVAIPCGHGSALKQTVLAIVVWTMQRFIIIGTASKQAFSFHGLDVGTTHPCIHSFTMHSVSH